MSADSARLKRVAFKRLAEPILGKMLQNEPTSPEDELVPYLKAGHLSWDGVQFPEDPPQMWASARERELLHPRAGDLLVCEGGEVGRAALVNEQLPQGTIIQNSLHLIKSGATYCARYLKYALEEVAQSGYVDILCNKATIAHLTVEKLRNLPIPLWTLGEQERIANFLDERTARIDALIAKKQRLLALLREARESVTEQVGSGSDSTGSAKLGFFVDLLPGYAFPSEGFSSDPTDTPLLRGVNLSPSSIRWDDVVYWPAGEDPALAKFVLAIGDVVFGMDRPWISTGARVAVVDEVSAGALLLQRVCRVRGGTHLRQRFIYYILASNAFRQSVEVDLTGVSVPHISPEQILRFKVPVLPLSEQDARCAAADETINRLERLAMHAEEALQRLREYRSSLIYTAVTGKVDIADSKVGA